MRPLIPSGSPPHVRPQPPHPPPAGRQQAAEHPDGRRLASAVGAEESEDLAPGNRQVNVVHGDEGAEALRPPAGFDGRVVDRCARRHHTLRAVISETKTSSSEGSIGRISCTVMPAAANRSRMRGAAAASGGPPPVPLRPPPAARR